MKRNEDLITVVVPVYNVAPYLTECIDSILKQDYKTTEIILVDDGSTDESGRICDKYAKENTNIHVIHQKNGGLSAARNKGISVAKGKYICFIDSDDYVMSDYISSLHQSAINNEADISICGYSNVTPPADTLTGSEATIRSLTAQENYDVLAWNKMYKLSLFKDFDITYPVGQVNEDSLTTYKLYSHANKVSCVPKELYYYRERENSITKKTDDEKRLQRRELAAKEAQYYLRGNEQLKQAADIALLTSKLTFIDNALTNRIDTHYFDEARKWILEHRDDYKNNQFLNKKLKLYFSLLSKANGKPYIAFRKVKHD